MYSKISCWSNIKVYEWGGRGHSTSSAAAKLNANDVTSSFMFYNPSKCIRSCIWSSCLCTSIDALFYNSFILIVFFSWISIMHTLLRHTRCSGYAFSFFFIFNDCEKHSSAFSYVFIFTVCNVTNALLVFTKNINL